MTKYCDHGHPLEEWMVECPFCPKSGDGIRKVMGNKTAATLSEAATEIAAPSALKATVMDGFTEFYQNPLKATVMDTEAGARKTVVLGQKEVSPRKPPEGPLPLLGWLVLMNGPEKWRDFRIDREKLIIGTGEECDVCLQDTAASTRHASVRKQTEGLFIVDLDSTNGTFLNNDPDPVSKRLLQDEDLIKVGTTYLKYRRL